MSLPLATVARNATCPCGSGRRFKSCCGSEASLRRPALPEELQRAMGLQQSGSLAEAERIYRDVLEREPNVADAVHMLGVIYLQSGNYADALRCLRRAAELFDWRFRAVHHNLGLAIAALLFGRNGARTQELWEAYDGWLDRLRSRRSDHRPVVSVVIAADESAGGADLLDSVLRQSYARLEIVVAAEVSADELRPLLATGPYRWQIHPRAPGGAAAMLNDAIRRSTGEFVNVLVENDRFAPTRIEAMVDAIARAGAAWGFSRAVLSDGGSLPSGPHGASTGTELAYFADDVAARDTVGMSLLSLNAARSASGLFFARSLFDEVGGFREVPCSEWDFCLRASIVAEPVYVPSAEYRRGAPQPVRVDRRAAEASLERFYETALATRSPANSFAPVPAVWGERFFIQLLAGGNAETLPPAVLRDLAERAAACSGADSD